MNVKQENSPQVKLSLHDKLPLGAAIIAAFPFHILLFFGILKAGITFLTLLYFAINFLIVYCMVKYLEYLFKDKKRAIKSLLLYQLLPALILSILLASWGKSNRTLDPKFKDRMEKYFSGRHDNF